MTDSLSAISYEVTLLPLEHELAVELLVPRDAVRSPLCLEVPTWVPGDYEFMQFGRDLFGITAHEIESCAPLGVTRVGWHTFQVQDSKASLRIAYRAYAYSIPFAEACGVVDNDVAVLLGTRYLRVSGWKGPCRVGYKLPNGWNVHHPAGATRVGEAVAWDYPSYEILLDSPVVFGQFDVLERHVENTNIYFVFVDRGFGQESQGGAFADAVASVSSEFHDIFGAFPFENYTFVLSTNPNFDWGLEHLTSSMCGLGPDVFVDPLLWATGVRVCAHELFHAWNVRRLRPAPLKQLDMERGSFTEGLWVAEGFTRYYEFLSCTRTGIYTVEQFFSSIVNYYSHLTATPAYGRVSATDSSLATYENHGKYPGRCNNSIDYYDKGMLLAFSADSQLRLQTQSDTLDRAFADFYRAYVDSHIGYTTQDVTEFFGRRLKGLGDILEHGAISPGGLIIEQLLDKLGFSLETRDSRVLGLMFLDGSNTIYGVLDESPAGRVGLAPNDLPLSIDGFAFTTKALAWAVQNRTQIRLVVQRGQRSLQFDLATEDRRQISALVWAGNDQQAQRIREWLHHEDFRPLAGQKFSLDFYDNFHGIETVL
jgi:predicted metalloprotease with PDZ domain